MVLQARVQSQAALKSPLTANLVRCAVVISKQSNHIAFDVLSFLKLQVIFRNYLAFLISLNRFGLLGLGLLFGRGLSESEHRSESEDSEMSEHIHI